MNRLILLAVLILAGGWNPTSAADAVRLGHDVVPTFQAVALEVDADRTDYRGSVTITLRVREATDHFDLHAQDMELTFVALEGPEGTVDARHERVDAERVRIVAAEALSPGEHTLRIAFEGPFNTQAVALYRMEQDGAGCAFTQFEADDARGAFPCFDEPGFKIPWQLTVKVPEAHIAVSNTPVESQTTSESWTTFVFQKTRPLPTYLIALATGPLETVEMPGLGVPARIVTLPGRTGLTAIAIRADASDPSSPRALLRSAVPVREARLHRDPRVLAGGHGAPRGDHLCLVHPPSRRRVGVSCAAALSCQGHQSRAGPHVVRGPGDDAVVGRPVAERVLCRLDG